MEIKARQKATYLGGQAGNRFAQTRTEVSQEGFTYGKRELES